MLTYNPEFVENAEYAYAVARIRALETRFIGPSGLGALAASGVDRFAAQFSDIAGIDGADLGTRRGAETALRALDDRFTEDYLLVVSLLSGDLPKRLVSLKYDYELLKLIVKEHYGAGFAVPRHLARRSRFSPETLREMLEKKKALETGPRMQDVYTALCARGASSKRISGREIEHRCDSAYYGELFEILGEMKNEYFTGYFIREVDAKNVLGTLRLKLLGGERGEVGARLLPYGAIDAGYFEEIPDLTLEGFAQRIVFSPLSSVLQKVDRTASEEEQVSELERLIDEDKVDYLHESIFVTFGVEPVLAYLFLKEVELKSLRTILVTKHAGLAESEIKRYVRGAYV
ncbi:MAG: V-type ATPase subunit [Spirochaetes bacterium]|nr:V-type ATPase subunit [Spirochaetota bacterium]